jgi:hypothetical protein
MEGEAAGHLNFRGVQFLSTALENLAVRFPVSRKTVPITAAGPQGEQPIVYR